MSYSYLFKYIIIGDTGNYPNLNYYKKALGNHVCYYNLLISDFVRSMKLL